MSDRVSTVIAVCITSWLIAHRAFSNKRGIHQAGLSSRITFPSCDAVNQSLFCFQCAVQGYKKSQAIQMLEHAEWLDKFYPKCYNNSTEIAFSQVIQMLVHLSDMGYIGTPILIYLVGVLFYCPLIVASLSQFEKSEYRSSKILYGCTNRAVKNC